MKSSLTLAIAMTSGYIALSYEILWYRIFAFTSRGLPTIFGLLLAFYLFGVAFGAYGSEKYCDTSSESRGRALRVIAIFVACASAVSFLVVPLTARLAISTLHFLEFQAWELAFVAVAVGAGMMGAVLPLVAHFGIDADDSAGLKLGYVYLANIIGSTLGSLLTGFVLTEIAGTQAISLGLALAGFAMSLVLLVWSGARGPELAKTGGAIAVAALVVVAGSGTAYDRIYERLLLKKDFTAQDRFKEIIENRHGVIAVDDQLELFGGGAYDGAFNISLVDDKNRIERAFAVAAMRPNAKNMLMIGLASGSWAQVLAGLPGLEHLTIVEIDPGYLELIPRYPDVASILTNPKVTIVIDDGRRWLLRHPDDKFDVIVMNTTWHWRAHVANLLSQDFLRIAHSHLVPGGLHYFNTTSSDSVQRTAALEFPYAFRFENFVAVSDAPISFDRDTWRHVLATATIDGRPALDLAQPRDREVLDGFVSVIDAAREQWASIEWRDDMLKRTEGARIVTDDNMACEWEPP